MIYQLTSAANPALVNVYLRNIILKRYGQVPQATSFLPDRVHVNISFNDFSSIAARKEGRSSKSTNYTGSFVPDFFKIPYIGSTTFVFFL